MFLPFLCIDFYQLSYKRLFHSFFFFFFVFRLSSECFFRICFVVLFSDFILLIVSFIANRSVFLLSDFVLKASFIGICSLFSFCDFLSNAPFEDNGLVFLFSHLDTSFGSSSHSPDANPIPQSHYKTC